MFNRTLINLCANFVVVTIILMTSSFSSAEIAKLEVYGEELEAPQTHKRIVLTDTDRTLRVTLEQFLRNQVGFESVDQFANTKSIYHRGSSTRQTLIEIDGVLLGDPSTIENSVDLNMISLSDVESIEMDEFAVGYASGTPSVVIKIKTFKKTGFLFRQTMGSYDGQQLDESQSHLSAQVFATPHLLVKLRGHFKNSTGYGVADVVDSRKKGFQNSDLFLSTHYQGSEDQELSFIFQNTKDRSDLVNGAYLDARDFMAISQNQNYGLSYVSGMNDFSVSYGLVDRRYTQSVDSTTDVGDSQDTDAPYKSSQLFLQNKTQIEDVQIVLFQKTQSQLETKQNWGYGEQTQKALSQNEFGMGLETKLETNSYSVGYSRHQIQGDFYNAQWITNLDLNSFFSSPKESYALVQYKSFAASLIQLMDPLSGNVDLKPESSATLEWGLQDQINADFGVPEAQLQTQLKIFYTRHWSLIDYNLVTNKYQNLTEAYLLGFEYSNSYKIATHMLKGSLQYLPIRDALSHKILLGRSPYIIGFEWENLISDSVTTTIDIKHNSERFMSADNKTKISPYTLVDFLLNYKISSQSCASGQESPIQDKCSHQISLVIKNLADQDYRIVSGYKTLGRNYLVQYEYKF